MEWNMFGFGRKKESSFCSDVKPLLTLSNTDFEYSVGQNIFKNFNYQFDVNLSGDSGNRVQQSKQGVEMIVGLFDGLYPVEKGYKRDQRGNLSSNSRKVDISYHLAEGFMPKSLVNIHFNARFDAESLSSAYVLLHLYGTNQEDLLAAHDAVVALPGVFKFPTALRSLEQIDRIRHGNGPQVQNFLLN